MMLPSRRGTATEVVDDPPMSDETTLTHLEAMMVALRDQLDHLTERVDARMAEQQLQLTRVRRELSRLEGAAGRRALVRIAPPARAGASEALMVDTAPHAARTTDR
jgi:hypothetical protein